MKMKYLAAAAAASLVPAAASAVTINPTTWGAAGCVGSASCVVDGATITAGPDGSLLDQQNFAGLSGLGVNSEADAGSGGPEPEIQALYDESITIDFTGVSSNGITLQSIELGHFYNTTDFADDPEERAIIDVLFGDDSVTTVTIDSISTDPDSFAFGDTAGLGLTVEKIDDDQGHYLLTDLFGGKNIKSLVFSAAVVAAPSDFDNSDYTIASVSAVPLPAAGFMLLAGLGGLAAMRRKRA